MPRDFVINWNTTTGLLTAVPGVYLMRGEPVRCVINTTDKELNDATELIVNLRKTGSFDGPSLVAIKEFEKINAKQWAANKCDRVPGIDALLEVNDDDADDVTTKPCVVQVRSALEDTITGKSDWLPVTLKNDYSRDDEHDAVESGSTVLTDPQGNTLTDPQGNVLIEPEG